MEDDDPALEEDTLEEDALDWAWLLELSELELTWLELDKLELERFEFERLEVDELEIEELLLRLELLAPWLLDDETEELARDELTELLNAEELANDELETDELAGCCDELAWDDGCDERATEDCACALDELPMITPPPLLLTLAPDERVYSEELAITLDVVFELALEVGKTLAWVDDWLEVASILLLDELLLILVTTLDELLGVDLPEEPPPQATNRLTDPTRLNLTKVLIIQASL